MTSVLPVVLAGGAGTRLWPLSRELYPKQFLKLTGDADDAAGHVAATRWSSTPRRHI